MDALICDELLIEIFQRLPPPCGAAVSLVSKRWRRLLRSSTTSLSLHFHPPYNTSTFASFSNFLTQHQFLSSLSLSATGYDNRPLLSVAACCPKLRHLRYLSSPVSIFSLYNLSNSCIYLSSIVITISRPLCLNWLSYFKSLKCLSLYLTNRNDDCELREVNDAVSDAGLSLESLTLCGILPGDYKISYLWRNCKCIKKLQLKNCESIGDYSSFERFLRLSTGLKELGLKTCRTIIDLVLFTLAKSSISLDSLLIYDGGSREGLLQFINQANCNVRRLDLRLPLDLNNTHLIALSDNLNFRGLVSLRLQSCCLVTGEGLKALGREIASGLEELALINCDVVEREPGLLSSLGQNLKKLRKLDLSYNDMLLNKELVSMVASCGFLAELKLRGCRRLTNAALDSIIKYCKGLEYVDIKYCCRIGVEGVELFVLNCPSLRRFEVEESKLSEVARKWASGKFMKVV